MDSLGRLLESTPDKVQQRETTRCLELGAGLGTVLRRL